MKGVILAAGVGSRLRPITDMKPKCLVKVAGQSIVDYQLRAFAAAGVQDVVIVTGYRADMIRQHCQGVPGIKIEIIENQSFATTNNMYSLYLALADLSGEPFVLCNGDVVLQAGVMRDLVGDPREDLIVTEAGTYADESMKITTNADRLIDDISKVVPKEMAYGCSTDVYKFSARSSDTFLAEVKRIIEEEQTSTEWTELALQRLLQAGSLKMQPFDIGANQWIEIDNYDDLAAADKAFSTFDASLRDKRVVFIDLDGTVYVGDKPIAGAKEFVERLANRRIPFYFLSNNSSRAQCDYVKKLAAMGIAVEEKNILLSTDGLIDYLVEEGVKDTYVIGTKSLRERISTAGIRPDSPTPAYVVLGYDTELTYEKLRQGALHLNNGVELLATHCDVVCPTAQGPVPDVGSIAALLEAATGKKPAKVFGKPNREMIQHVMEQHRADPSEVVVIGDRLYTDMAMADAVGCDFVLVLSGETNREDIENTDGFPALVVPDLGHVLPDSDSTQFTQKSEKTSRQAA